MEQQVDGEQTRDGVLRILYFFTLRFVFDLPLAYYMIYRHTSNRHMSQTHLPLPSPIGREEEDETPTTSTSR